MNLASTLEMAAAQEYTKPTLSCHVHVNLLQLYSLAHLLKVPLCELISPVEQRLAKNWAHAGIIVVPARWRKNCDVRASQHLQSCSQHFHQSQGSRCPVDSCTALPEMGCDRVWTHLFAARTLLTSARFQRPFSPATPLHLLI